MDLYSKEKAETQQQHAKVIEDLMAQHVKVTSLWAQEQSQQMEDLRQTISSELSGVHEHEKEVLQMKLMMAAHVRCLLQRSVDICYGALLSSVCVILLEVDKALYAE